MVNGELSSAWAGAGSWVVLVRLHLLKKGLSRYTVARKEMIVSFLLDPPLLMASGSVIERALPTDWRRPAAVAVSAVFVGVSVAIYQNIPVVSLLAKPFGSASGRDFMWNSGVFRLPVDRFGPRAHVAAGAIFATYPLWLQFGRCAVSANERSR